MWLPVTRTGRGGKIMKFAWRNLWMAPKNMTRECASTHRPTWWRRQSPPESSWPRTCRRQSRCVLHSWSWASCTCCSHCPSTQPHIYPLGLTNTDVNSLCLHCKRSRPTIICIHTEQITMEHLIVVSIRYSCWLFCQHDNICQWLQLNHTNGVTLILG